MHSPVSFDVPYEKSIQDGASMSKGRKATAKSQKTMAMLRSDRDLRRRESVRLRQEGFTLRECAEALSVSIPTIASDLAAMGIKSGDKYRSRATQLWGLDGVPPVTPAPSENGTHGAVEPDWDALLSEAISTLRRKADAGVVGAATAIAKMAVQESRTGSCVRHVPLDDVNLMVREICTAYADEFRGVFVRTLESSGVTKSNMMMPHVEASLVRVYMTLQGRLNPNDSPDGVMP